MTPAVPFCCNHENYLQFHLQTAPSHRSNKQDHANAFQEIRCPTKSLYCMFSSSACCTPCIVCQTMTSSFFFARYLLNNLAAILPEIMEGGTPGPGTVNCPA